MLRMRVDPHSPIPLYHQIAERIRAAIEAGELRSGDALTPLREAADAWGVNVHTVRHAYTSLARDGLLESSRGAKGTRVASLREGRGPDPGAAPPLHRFVDSVLSEARAQYGLDAESFAALLAGGRRDDRAQPFVVECSRWQAESHAREIAAVFEVSPLPWVLADGEPPRGLVVATYFHYNDIRRHWPRRLGEVQFVSIRPDPALRQKLAGIRSIRVCETDPRTADAVAADLSALFEPGRVRISTKVASDPNALLPSSGRERLHLFAPRVWAELDEEARNHPRVDELRYVFDLGELYALGTRAGWRRRASADMRRAG